MWTRNTFNKTIERAEIEWRECSSGNIYGDDTVYRAWHVGRGKYVPEILTKPLPPKRKLYYQRIDPNPYGGSPWSQADCIRFCEEHKAREAKK